MIKQIDNIDNIYTINIFYKIKPCLKMLLPNSNDIRVRRLNILTSL